MDREKIKSDIKLLEAANKARAKQIKEVEKVIVSLKKKLKAQ